MWWRSQSDELRQQLVAVQKERIDILEKRHQTDCERVDRLMEALARKSNIDLIMPLPAPVPVERVVVPNPWKDPNVVTDKFKEMQ